MSDTDADHDAIAELLGAYALDAVEPSEARRVEGHLDRCPICRRELDGLREVAGALGHASEDPPETLWDRIRESVRASSPGSQTHDESVVLSLVGSELSGIHDSRRTGAARSGGATRSAGSTRSARWRRSAAAAIGVGAAAAIAALSLGLANANDRAGQLGAALQRVGSSAPVLAALKSPGHRVVELRSPRGVKAAELVLRSDGNGYVVTSDLAPLPSDKTYQLWASIGGRPISLGLMGGRLKLGEGFSLGNGAMVAKEIMITVEPRYGVVAPTAAPIVTGRLSEH